MNFMSVRLSASRRIASLAFVYYLVSGISPEAGNFSQKVTRLSKTHQKIWAFITTNLLLYRYETSSWQYNNCLLDFLSQIEFSSVFGLKIFDRICLVSAPTDFQGSMAQRSDHHMLEEENDKMVDHLSSKVQALKSVLC